MLASRSWSRALVLLLGVGLAGAGVAACAGLLGIEDLQNAPEAGVDAASDVVDSGPFVCTPAHPPARGDGGDSDGGSDYILAMNALSAGLEQNVQVDFAWDLDDHCTCQDKVTPEACIRPNPTALETCDGKDGRDLSGNLALRQATALVAGVSDSNLKKQLELGKFGAIIVLRGYDGTPDDPKVRVDFAPSYGTILTDDAGAPILNGSNNLQPAPLKHDGTDKWSWAPQFATAANGSINALTHDDAAYVRDGVMVAHFSVAYVAVQFDLTNSNQLVFRVDDVLLSAKVGKTANGIELTEGRLGGRAGIASMLRSFGAWTDPTGGDLCEGSVAYSAIQGGLCRNRDIRGSAADDHKNLPCDAISFGLGFGAEKATLFGAVDYAYKKTSCFNGTVPLAPATGDPCAK